MCDRLCVRTHYTHEYVCESLHHCIYVWYIVRLYVFIMNDLQCTLCISRPPVTTHSWVWRLAGRRVDGWLDIHIDWRMGCSWCSPGDVLLTPEVGSTWRHKAWFSKRPQFEQWRNNGSSVTRWKTAGVLGGVVLTTPFVSHIARRGKVQRTRRHTAVAMTTLSSKVHVNPHPVLLQASIFKGQKHSGDLVVTKNYSSTPPSKQHFYKLKC